MRWLTGHTESIGPLDKYRMSVYTGNRVGITRMLDVPSRWKVGQRVVADLVRVVDEHVASGETAQRVLVEPRLVGEATAVVHHAEPVPARSCGTPASRCVSRVSDA